MNGTDYVVEEIATKDGVISLKNWQIDITEDAVYVVKSGEVTKVEKPSTGYGHQNIVWLGGKVDRVESTESRKI